MPTIRELGHEPAEGWPREVEEGWGRKIANGYENERGERTSIAIVSSTFARSPTRVVVNKRGDEGALYKEKDSFLFDLSLSLFSSSLFLFFLPPMFFSRFIIAV